LSFGQKKRQPTNKIIAVGLIGKDLAPFDTTADNVVQNSGSIYSGLAGHGWKIKWIRPAVNL
jgi:hypothetical protein